MCNICLPQVLEKFVLSITMGNDLRLMYDSWIQLGAEDHCGQGC